MSKKDQDFLKAYEIEAEQMMFNLRWTDIPDINEVIKDQLWIGGERCATNPWELSARGITAVLNMAVELDQFDYHGPEHWEGISITKIGIDDGQMTPVNVFRKAAEVINKHISNGDKIYVHCAAGVSRSVTAVCTYLMVYNGMNFLEARNFVRSKRPVACPHPLLVRSLIRDLGDEFDW